MENNNGENNLNEQEIDSSGLKYLMKIFSEERENVAVLIASSVLDDTGFLESVEELKNISPKISTTVVFPDGSFEHTGSLYSYDREANKTEEDTHIDKMVDVMKVMGEKEYFIILGVPEEDKNSYTPSEKTLVVSK